MLEYTPPTIVLGGQSEVYVTHAVDPSHFHCQLMESAVKLKELMDEIHEHCSSSDPREEALSSCDLGMPCLVQHSADKEWYRVIISGMLANGLMEVLFVDYGNIEIADMTRLRKMKPEFMELPIQAVPCGMINLAPPKGFWPPEHIAQFADMVVENTFIASFISLIESDSVCCVELVSRCGMSINKVFGTTTETFKIDSGYKLGPVGSLLLPVIYTEQGCKREAFREGGSSRGFGAEGKLSSGSDSISGGRKLFRGSDRTTSRFSSGDGDKDYTPRTREDSRPSYSDRKWAEGKRERIRKAFTSDCSADRRRGNYNGHDNRFSTDYTATSQSVPHHRSGNTWASGFGRSGKTEPSATITDIYKSIALGLGEVSEVYISFVNTPGEFWIQLSSSTDQIDELMEKINSFYSTLGPNDNCLSNASRGAVCVAKFTEDDRWYRGMVTQNKSGSCEVQFVDYGNSEFVSVNGLKSVTPNFLELPVQAIKCCLNSVDKLGTEWSDEVIQKFEELTLEKPLSCKIIGSGREGSTSVQLTDESTGNVIAQALLQAGLVNSLQSQGQPGGGNKSPEKPTAPFPVGTFKEQSFNNSQKANVVVSCMTHPEDFWCQLVSQQQQIIDLNKNLQLQCEKSKNSSIQPNSLRKDMGVVAKFSQDKCWYRGKIIDMASSKARVLFVDYGNIETVPFLELQYAQETTLKTPMLAVKCTLKDVKPVGGSWSPKAIGLIKSVVGDKSSAVFHQRQGDCYLVDLLVEGKSAAKELVKAGYATLPGESGSGSGTKNFTHMGEIRVNCELNVYVTSIDGVDSFWCQPSYAQTVDLEAAYSTPVETLVNPSAGMPCVTKYSSDELWYRAEVIRVSGNDCVVRFVDYGNCENAKKSDLKCVKPEFFSIPMQSFHCKLNGIKDTGGAEVKKKFNEITQDKELQAKITGKEDDLFCLDLLEGETPVYKQLLPFFPQEEVDNSDYLPVPNMSGQTFKAYVSAAGSLDEFYIQPADSQTELDHMIELMKQYEKGSCSQLCDPKVGDICAVKYSEDNAWYRGKITSIKENFVRAIFVDYGNSEDVALSDTRKILPTILDVPPLSYPCCLANAKRPASGWSTEAFTLFEECVMDQEFACKVLTKSTVTITAAGEDVGQLLVRKGFSQNPEGQSSSAAAKGYPAPELDSKTFCGYVSAVQESGVYIQPTANTEQLDTMVEKLQGFSASLESEPGFGSVELNQCCCAKCSVDDSWYRGLVVKKEGDKATVSFVDYGNSELFNISVLKTVPEALTKQAPLALHCCISEKPSLTQAEIDEIMQKTQDKEITIQILTQTSPYTVKLIDENDLALLQTSKASSAVITKSLPIAQLNLGTDKGNITEVDPTGENDDDRMEITLKSFPQVVIPDGEAKGYVTCIEKTGLVYIQLTRDEEKLEALADKLQIAAESSPSLQKVSVGNVCCARFSEDEMWYRALVLTCKSPNVQVRFLDDGNTDTSDENALRVVPQEMLQEPFYCLVCRPKGCSELSGDHVASLYELTSDRIISINFLSHTEPYEITLASLEGEDLVSESLKQSEVNPQESKTEQSSGPSSEGENFDVYKKQVVPEQSSGPSSEGENFDVYKKQVVPKGEKLAYVTHVDPSGWFYVQLEDDTQKIHSLSEKMLESTEALEEGNNRLDIVEEGAPCCCKYSEDGLWYRARVTCKAEFNISVRFVDYGYEDTVPETEVCAIPISVRTQPPFGFACRLQGIELTPHQVGKFREITADEPVNVIFLTSTEPYDITMTNYEGKLIQTLLGSGIDHVTAIVDRLVADSIAESSSKDERSTVEGYQKLTLNVGSREEMYVTEAVSPDFFWCRPAAADGLLTELMDAVEDYCGQLAEGERSSIAFRPGMPCLAKLTQDEGWYRAKTVSVQETGVEVLFVDYGNTDVVPEVDVVQIKPEHMTLPAQAVLCKLYSQEPASYSEEVVDKFVNITSEKKLLVEIISSEASDSDLIYAVKLLEIGVDISTQLHENVGRNVLAEDSECENKTEFLHLQDAMQVQHHDSITVISETTENFSEANISSSGDFERINMTEGSQLGVTVCHADSPSHFWIQLISNETQLSTMMKLLHERMSSTLGETSRPSVNQPCAAWSAEDEMWYRGVVKEFNPALNEGLTDVFFVDYGRTESVETIDVRLIPPELMELPVQAIECGLSEIRFQGTVWPANAKIRFNDLVLNRNLIVIIIHVGKDWDCIVQLLDKKGKSVANTLIREGFGVSTDTEIQTPPHLKSVQSKAASAATDEKEDIPKILLTVGERRSVNVTHVASPGHFWCQLSPLPELDDLKTKLQISFKTSTPLVMQPVWKVGQLCMAKCGEDQQVYRARIVSLTKEVAEVFNLDYGNVVNVPVSSLQPITKDLLNFPAQAFHCSLAKIEPEDAEWEDPSCRRFEEITYQKELTADVIGFEDNTALVLLEDGNTSINQSLIESGYALQDPNTAMLGKVSRTLETLESTAIGFTCGKKPLPELPSPIAGSENGDLRKLDVTHLPIDVPNMKHYTNLEFDEGNKLSVLICNITDPGSFGIQPADSSADLESLMSDIAEYISSDNTVVNTDQLRPGFLCLAQSSDDDTWYRAKITDILNEKYQVTFVDYGISDICPESKIRALPETMLSLPVQYIPCCLADIWADGDDWSAETIAFFKDLCISNTLKADVCKKENGFYHIYLYDTNERTDWTLNRYLLYKGVSIIPGSALDLALQLDDSLQFDLDEERDAVAADETKE